ncbi:hypothetical protein D3C83_168920 [compost metagenome]
MLLKGFTYCSLPSLCLGHVVLLDLINLTRHFNDRDGSICATPAGESLVDMIGLHPPFDK